jgi:cytochrome d ubiquinol oxidase subunit II
VQAIAVFAIIGAAWAVRDGHDGWAFTATSVAMATSVLSLFIDLYPNVMVSSTNSSYNLTVAGSASSSYALKVMTIVAVVFFPLVLVYQSWSYFTFRGRINGPRLDTPPPETAAPEPSGPGVSPLPSTPS